MVDRCCDQAEGSLRLSAPAPDAPAAPHRMQGTEAKAMSEDELPRTLAPPWKVCAMPPAWEI